MTIVKAGTLDDVHLLNSLKPTAEIYTKDEVKWLPHLAEVRQEWTM